MLGSLIVYLKGMRIMMFQLSGYYCKELPSFPHAPNKAEALLQNSGSPRPTLGELLHHLRIGQFLDLFLGFHNGPKV